MHRRSVLKWIAAAPVVITLPLKSETVPDTRIWKTLEAVQQHLLPGGNGAPSARQVRATNYLYMTMRHSSFDYEIRDFVLQGALWAESEAVGLYGRSFDLLKAGEQARICQILVHEYGRGESWLSTLISYTLEALLSDPIYGGNVDEAGWKWLGHVPGTPRPKQRFVHDV
ncbi:MAG: gluconate 2-dehydrogenase subunit 3 family protein [Sulfurimonadaceae bacterium]|nr:gluconate 2-dehydrogenase subunit 3 family protein [Sulfurimonadaceae bacterium]